MIRISICDDDNTIIEEISSITQLLREDIEVFSYSSGENLLDSEYLSNDIIILDIEMQGINGIYAARQLRINGYEGIIIFLTSHSEMVFDSFQVKPYQYLVKPLDINFYKSTLLDAITELEERRSNHFEAVHNNHTYRLPLGDIYFFESQGRNINIYTKNEVVNVIGKMNKIEMSLKNKFFFRCHKGYLVNLEHIYQFSNNEITLTNNQKVLISRLKLNSFRETFKAFMKGNRKQ